VVYSLDFSAANPDMPANPDIAVNIADLNGMNTP
jgi:hypothetical protein